MNIERKHVLKSLHKLGDKVVYEDSLLCKYHVFKNREDAGNRLSRLLTAVRIHKDNAVVMAIPRGGVPVAYAISLNLEIPMDVLICRKILIPWNTEAGFGAIAPDGTIILNERLLNMLGLEEDLIDRQIKRATNEMRALISKFRGSNKYDIKDKDVILVDDGIASGYTMLVAVKFIKNLRASRIIIASPTAPISSLIMIAPEVDLIVCPNIRSSIYGFAVADAYQLWYDLTDEEVLDYIEGIKRRALWYPDLEKVNNT